VIRKFGRLAAAPEQVRTLFEDLEGWARWMPGVRAARIVAGGGDACTLAVTQEFAGRRFQQVLDCRRGATGITAKQVSGFCRRFESAWRFLPAPHGGGTTLVFELDVDFGVMGLLVPGTLIQTNIDRTFAQTVAAVRERLAAVEPAQAASVRRLSVDLGGERQDAVLLQVFQTEQGLEINVAGRCYTIPLGAGARGA